MNETSEDVFKVICIVERRNEFPFDFRSNGVLIFIGNESERG